MHSQSIHFLHKLCDALLDKNWNDLQCIIIDGIMAKIVVFKKHIMFKFVNTTCMYQSNFALNYQKESVFQSQLFCHIYSHQKSMNR